MRPNPGIPIPMHDFSEDGALLRRQRQFMHDIERSIREENRELIHASIPPLTTESFQRFARLVARLRAAYLHAALELAEREGADPAAARTVAALREPREAFEEAREAFEALQRAIERGYVDLASAVGTPT